MRGLGGVRNFRVMEFVPGDARRPNQARSVQPLVHYGEASFSVANLP
jgi:hypothetical protein